MLRFENSVIPRRIRFRKIRRQRIIIETAASPSSTCRTMKMRRGSLPMISSRRLLVGSSGGFTRSLGAGIMIVAIALSCAACGQSPVVVTAFRTEQQAQQHCPSDTVVWLDPQSGIYQAKGHGSYGRSAAGRYACLGEAKRAGMHATAN